MAGEDGNAGDGIPPAEFTTNAKDQAEAAKLLARIASSSSSEAAAASGTTTTTSTTPTLRGNFSPVPSVQIDDGAHKYVLVSAVEPAQRSEGSAGPLRRDFVVSRRGAAYHRDAAEPLVDLLEKKGYIDIRVNGGGRIFMDETKRRISIFGYSYGFGQADHARAKEVIEADDRYKDFNITWSNDGY